MQESLIGIFVSRNAYNFALHFNGTTDQDNHTASETLRTRIIINFLHLLMDKFATSLLK